MLCESQASWVISYYSGGVRRRPENKKKPRSDARWCANVPLRLLLKVFTGCCPRLLVAVVKTPIRLIGAGRIVAQGLNIVKKKRNRQTANTAPAFLILWLALEIRAGCR